ncbi:hypothetical protein Mal35_14220 [Gimesia maris]|uniref:DUF1579 domain-containing protein n=1 Tax=Gimesia maris TaxID=122 RepID=UPI00118C9F61|nr:DUF1579 domain-containing protein [Gimesia maris]QDT77992.1 hypothetical protein Mal35_14220 [Gimesia maris]
MFEKPQAEHSWLEPLLGDWLTEAECQMGPGEPLHKSTGETRCRSMEGMWYLLEGSGDEPEGGPWSTLMTLGYDAKKSCYTGTCVGSMMTHLWLYTSGVISEGKKLILNTEGPNFHGEGMTSYKDIIELVDDSHWILTSEILTDEGKWQQIVTSHYRRQT